MAETAEKLIVFNRKPNKFRFRILEDEKIKSRSNIIMMNEVTGEKISWLWEPYIPLGRLTMLGGDPGAGKSFITTAIAAALSRGDSLPGEEEGIRDPMNTLLLNAEDDPSDTLKPRLTNLHADQTRIAVSIEDIIIDVDGLKAIEKMVVYANAKLLIVDPIVAFLGPKVDMNRANEVRHVMKGLSSIARKLNIAVVVVRHNRKQTGVGKAIYAGNGSIDFTAAVRSELAVAEAKNGEKYLNHIKANSGRLGPSIRYEIEPLEDGSGLFRWLDFVEQPSFGARAGISRRFKNEDKIKSWLHDVLKDCPNGMSAKEVSSLALASGYSQTKLDHAKKGIALSTKRGSEWIWTLDPSARVDVADASMVL